MIPLTRSHSNCYHYIPNHDSSHTITRKIRTKCNGTLCEERKLKFYLFFLQGTSLLSQHPLSVSLRHVWLSLLFDAKCWITCQHKKQSFEYSVIFYAYKSLNVVSACFNHQIIDKFRHWRLVIKFIHSGRCIFKLSNHRQLCIQILQSLKITVYPSHPISRGCISKSSKSEALVCPNHPIRDRIVSRSSNQRQSFTSIHPIRC